MVEEFTKRKVDGDNCGGSRNGDGVGRSYGGRKKKKRF